MTENPRVVAGLIEVFGSWIDRFGIDGFRIDTAKHVNPEFWQAFVPAMLSRAKARGIPNFHIFGEVYQDAMEPGMLAVHTRVDKYPSVLDFAFRAAALKTVAGDAGSETWERLFFGDPLYEGGADKARQLPTFVSNHDAGRFSMFVKRAFPKASDAELLDRVELGHAMLLLLRGVPTIYSGDEQGFVSDEGDQGAREDMFASKVASYNDNKLLGSDRTTAQANFNSGHPLVRLIATLAKVRHDTPALRRGRQLTRAASQKPGLFAASRFDPVTGKEVLLLFNTSNVAITQNVVVDVKSLKFVALAGNCATDGRGAGQREGHLAGARLCRVRGAMMDTVSVLDSPGHAPADAWWRGAVVYQIYPRSFADSNGDGIGDLKGATERLDHVADLGCDAIWVSPFFLSPMKDFGYDVADYCRVDPIFGTLDDLDALIARAHALGLKVMIDQVYSHTSDEHQWFADSRASRDNDKADWYVWADPKADGSPPNNWQSVFGGPSWTWDARRQQYYHHNFLKEQPQLNVHHPEVQDGAARRGALLARPRGRRFPARCAQFHDARSGADR